MKKNVLLISLCVFALFANAQSKTNVALPSLSQSDFTVVERISDGTIRSVKFENSSLRVYDASSLQMKVAESQVNENYLLDTSSWKRGLYIVEVTIGSKTYTTKLVVK